MTVEPDDGAAPLVSVLLPCWNAEDSIARSLESVLGDRSFPLECIVVDDASTDRTAEIVSGLAMLDRRVVLVRQAKNEGVSVARNRGLELVRGEWLTFVDADDRFVGGGLGALVRAGRERAALAVIGQQVWTDGRRRWLTELYDIPDIRTPRRTSLGASPGLVYYVSPHAKLFHRSVIEGLRFEGRVLGDQPWIVRALLRAGDRIEVLGETVYEWWRPVRGRQATSITVSTRSSARRGVEAAEIAGTAFRQVADEAEARIADPSARQRVLAAYVERLLRSDLAAHLSGALSRGDPAATDLLAAIEGFVAGVPPALLAGSNALAVDVLEPPLRRWPRLGPPARRAYWSLLEAAGAADPLVWRRGSDPIARTALRLALRPTPRRRAASIALMLADGLASAARTAARRLRRAASLLARPGT